jgi:hypothetical protein
VVSVQHHNPTGMTRLVSTGRGRSCVKVQGTWCADHCQAWPDALWPDEGEEIGRSIALSMDGMTLAVGADGTEAKIVEFTSSIHSAFWVQLGEDLCADGQGREQTCACDDSSTMEQIVTIVSSESLGIRQALI